ncbi:ABC transporter permease [Arthrobacter sp. AZCC_0090]|uniref:ABC transporter permease n=1 Tax=Arthrobacter sp. AZCC_0090 TaxID=2735881 RepID=UPI0016170E8B|nr:ABC transporter permease subunit [Arthrobacter sp. AZCC_0090]MBB6406629.1 ABC-type transport system involved in multi-copper enzyme maturation permease subunit [Arthrobacter sp. AZCC_0090]
MSNVTEAVPSPGPQGSPAGPRGTTGGWNAVVGYLRGIRDVVVLEMKQRLRSRGWYIMLGIWFVVIAVVTWLTWLAWNATMEARRSVTAMSPQDGAGSMIFEVVLAFVLLFALLVAPALSAHAIDGDRAGGTLAILQITLLTPGQILWGKFCAGWLAALAFLATSAPFLVFGMFQGGLTVGHVVVSLVMLAVELAVVCGIGVGISALAGRPLFSIVVTYLAVAALVVGSLISFGLGSQLAQGTVLANTPQARSVLYAPAQPNQQGQPTEPVQPGYTCGGPLVEHPALRTERVAWMLALNPYVVVADAIPYPDRSGSAFYSAGMIESISQGARSALAGPDHTYLCANGVPQPQYLKQTTPLWPLGLGLQLVLTGLLMWLGWRSLRTPAGRLPRGTRIA